MRKTSLLFCFVAIQVVWASADGFAIAQEGTGVQIPGSGGSGPTNSGPTPNDPTNWGDPPPTTVGLCAYELIGSANNVWYFTTCTCINGNPAAPFGFGQSKTQPAALKCSETGCASVIAPASNIITETSIEQVRDTLLKILGEKSTSRAKRTHAHSLLDNVLTAEFQYDDLIDRGLTADAHTLTEAVLAEWKKHAAYFRVNSSATEFRFGDGPDPGVAVGHSDLVDTDAPLLSSLPTEVDFVVEASVATEFLDRLEDVVVVDFLKSDGTSEKRYFQLFYLRRKAPTRPERVLFGQQIQAVPNPDGVAKVVDIGRFTHVIEYAGQTFQVNSYDDLKALSGM